MTIKQLYTFHRAEGFYPMELSSEDHPSKIHPDDQVIDHVRANPGTLKVVNEISGKIIYDAACP